MNEVRERLDGLLVDVAARVGPDPGAAWQRGRRRRGVRTATVGALAALVVGAVALVGVDRVASEALPPASRPAAGDGYPQRISDPWLDRGIEDAPGSLAGWLDAGGSLYGVAASGALYRLPQGDDTGDFQAFLSPDGRKVGWLAAPTRFVVRDLATGEEVEYDGIGDNRGTSTEEYVIFGQMPGFWSPDNRHLAITGSRNGPEAGGSILVLDDVGGIREVARSKGAFVAGWIDDTQLAWVRERARKVELVTSDLAGVVVRRILLDAPAPGRVGVSQWTGAVSPDGERLAVLGGDRVRVVDAATGERVATGDPGTGLDGLCSASWRGEEPLVLSWAEDGSTLVSGLDREVVSRIEPSLEVRCLHLTPTGLRGDPSGGRLFGTSNSWLSWHVGEVGLAVAVLLVGGSGAVRWRRRRRADRA